MRKGIGKRSHGIGSPRRTTLIRQSPITNDHVRNLNSFTRIPHRSACTCDGGCPRCIGIIQPKLTIGRPGDRFEREADRVADQIMRKPIVDIQRQCMEEEEEALQTKSISDVPIHLLQRQPIEEEEVLQTKSISDGLIPLIQRQPIEEEEEEEVLQAESVSDGLIPIMQKQPLEEEEEMLQTKPTSSRSSISSGGLQNRIQNMRNGGFPLPYATRAFFESRFGYDFSNVRLHTDSMSSKLAADFQARAFTIGSDITLGSGQYSPGTTQGMKLLAHELTHVVQQSSNGRKANHIQRTPGNGSGSTITAGVPPGVHDARTAFHYARARRLFRTFTGFPNRQLIEEAQRLDTFLMGQCSRFGREAQSEFALLLIDMEREMSRRLRAAELGPHLLPRVEGVTWDPEDPLAGTTEAIPPFSMLDAWSTLASGPLPGVPGERPTPARRPSRGITAVIHWAQRGTSGGIVPAGSRHNVDVGERVWVYGEHSLNPGGGRITYQWHLNSYPQGFLESRASLSSPSGVRARFTPDVPGRYTVILTVSNQRTHQTDRCLVSFFARSRSREERERRPRPPPSGRGGGEQTWSRSQCAEREIAGVPGIISGGRYFYGAHTTRHGNICYGRYDCATDTCSPRWAEFSGNPVYTRQFNEGRDDVQGNNVSRSRYLRDRLYRLGVDHERRRQGRTGAIRFNRD